MWCANIYFKMWMWIVISLNIISKLHGYSGGYFPEACDSMLPDHNGAAPQNTKPPYMVEYVPSSYPGEPVTVLLKSEESTYFRGFMLEAREVADETRLTGRFVLLEPDKTQLLTCGVLEDSAVSQKNNLKKTLIRVNWTATEAEQDIMFRATFLLKKVQFWEKVNIILPQRTTTTTTTPETSTTLETSTTPNIYYTANIYYTRNIYYTGNNYYTRNIYYTANIYYTRNIYYTGNNYYTKHHKVQHQHRRSKNPQVDLIL
ncbi:putative ferric-chelate reductase 1 [Neolamprologus brichardi]|uniref:putative ferric-chelate reductase 1 n=1 Tax=Neolamprologus brichardi TaxID=32507 RepID=UPI001643C3B8|nr:putative ferric-chelate reductase 1 [Neolamprologus brichardi]